MSSLICFLPCRAHRRAEPHGEQRPPSGGDDTAGRYGRIIGATRSQCSYDEHQQSDGAARLGRSRLSGSHRCTSILSVEKKLILSFRNAALPFLSSSKIVSSFCSTATHSHACLLQALLRSPSTDMDAADDRGLTALHHTTANDNELSAKLLVSALSLFTHIAASYTQHSLLHTLQPLTHSTASYTHYSLLHTAQPLTHITTSYTHYILLHTAQPLNQPREVTRCYRRKLTCSVACEIHTIMNISLLINNVQTVLNLYLFSKIKIAFSLVI